MEWNYMEISWVEEKESCWAPISYFKNQNPGRRVGLPDKCFPPGDPPLYYKFKVRNPAWAGALDS